MFEWHKKEKPFLGMAGMGGGVVSKLVGGAGAFSATGGNVDALEPGNGYVYHTFTGPGTLTVSGQREGAQWFLVGPGGGGAGGNGSSGGGGAGGILFASNYSLSSGTYTITLPNGGPGGQGINASGDTGGDATVVGPDISLTAKSGGGGDGWSTTSNNPSGGCGGGAGNPTTSKGSSIQSTTPQTAPGTTYITHYGNPGGDSNTSAPYRGGGGGGTRLAGTAAGPSRGGDGEVFSDFLGTYIGVPSLNPLSATFGGGGGGGTEAPYGSGGLGGLGGGGTAAQSNGQDGADGFTYSGGGGGAGTYPTAGNGGDGGKGIIVVRYPTSITRTTYRYWRLYKTDSAQGGGYHREIQWFEPGAADYYQGTNYQNWVQSGLSAFNSDRVTDGDVSTNCFHTDSAGVGSWVKLDLGAGNEKYFNKVAVVVGNPNSIYAVWEVQASNDNTNWVAFHSGINVYPGSKTRYW